MIDKEGFRLNVGIIISKNNAVFWGQKYTGLRTVETNIWQFPQGGINPYETPKETMYRELFEETGLQKKDVKILAFTKKWLYYRLPKKLLRKKKPLCIGQKQKWFLLELVTDESNINFQKFEKPEFSSYEWVDYWHPLTKVVYFKKHVYQKVLNEFFPVFNNYYNHAKLPLKNDE